jgi:hypothetical protein
MYNYGKPGKTEWVEVNCSPTVTSDGKKEGLEEFACTANIHPPP